MPVCVAAALFCRHLKDLLADQARCEALTKEDLGLYIDFSRQRATQDTIKVRSMDGLYEQEFLLCGALDVGSCERLLVSVASVAVRRCS
jgi:hypothetical protein